MLSKQELFSLTETQLNEFSFRDIRDIATVLKCPSPTSCSKAENISNILAIIKGEMTPTEQSRGRKKIKPMGDLLLDDGFVAPNEVQTQLTPLFDEEKEEKADFEVSGVLEVVPNGYGFLRKSYVNNPDDIYVQQKHIQTYKLQTGDYIVGRGKKFESSRQPAMVFVNSINGGSISDHFARQNFDDLKAVFPDKRLTLEGGTNKLDFALRAIDLVAPIGRGQRGLIVSPPKSGKTTLLKKMAQAITKNHPDVHVIMLLIGERPEEVTDIEREVQCEVAASTFDQKPSHHIKIADLVLRRAKNLVAMKKDVVVLMDSLTRLTRACNLACEQGGRTLSGGLDVAALNDPKKFFGAARNTDGCGSLTIIATALVETGNKMDDIIYEEFKGTGNMEIHLDRKLSEMRIFPAIDLRRSGTRREDLLYSEDEMAGIWQVRRLLSRADNSESAEFLLDLITKTQSNKELIETLKKSKN